MIASEKPPRTAPVYYDRCPIHESLVLFDGDKKMLGICDACTLQAAAGLKWLKAHPYRSAA